MELRRETVEANSRTQSVLRAGDAGPLILFCHGFPELAHSWRHQLPAVAAAGYRAVAPDMRGYGATGGPQDVEAYTVFQLVGDMVGLVHALGEQQAVIVGHDWGATVAWQAALLRPDIFKAVCAMSVPFQPRRVGKPPLTTYRQISAEKNLGEFYIVAFQEVGRAEADFEADVDRTMRAVFGGIAATSGPADRFMLYNTPGMPLIERHDPRPLPDWLAPADFAVFVEAFRTGGFRRPLNWYRNIDRNWDLSAPYQGAAISQPALFITGERDPVRVFTGAAEKALLQTVPHLRDVSVVDGAGHWVQQEKPAAVNAALLSFLAGI